MQTDSFSVWTGVQILIVLLVLAWFFKTLRIPTKHSQRQAQRREELLECRRNVVAQKVMEKEQQALAEKEEAKK